MHFLSFLNKPKQVTKKTKCMMANGCEWEMRQEIFNTRMSKCHLELKDTQGVMECNFICSVACT